MQTDFLGRIMATVPDQTSEPQEEVGAGETVLGVMSEFAQKVNHLGFSVNTEMSKLLTNLRRMGETHRELHNCGSEDLEDREVCRKFRQEAQALINQIEALRDERNALKKVLEGLIFLEFPSVGPAKGKNLGMRKGYVIVVENDELRQTLTDLIEELDQSFAEYFSGRGEMGRANTSADELLFGAQMGRA